MTSGRKQIEIDIDVNRVIEAGRLHFGETENDILRRLLLGTKDKPKAIKLQPAERRNERVTGDFSFALFGKTHPANSLKDGYKKILRELVKRDSGFAPRLAEVKTPARRLIARTPEALYMSSPHLAKDFAERLDDAWWVDLNLSTQQVRRRVEITCNIANIEMGRDLEFPFPGGDAGQSSP